MLIVMLTLKVASVFSYIVLSPAPTLPEQLKGASAGHTGAPATLYNNHEPVNTVVLRLVVFAQRTMQNRKGLYLKS